MAKEINDKSVTEISKQIGALIHKLHGDGYQQPISVVLVMGGTKRNEVFTLPVISHAFIGETLNALDNFIANVKVNGIPTSTANIMGLNKDGEVKTYEGEQADAFLKNARLTEVAGLINELHSQIISQLESDEDKKKFRGKMLQTLIIAIGSGNEEWMGLETSVRMTIVADAIMELRTEHGLKMLDTDYTDTELENAIKDIDHIVKFGYERKDDKNDIAYG